MALVVLQFVGQLALVAETPVVKPVEAGYPVAVLQFAIALQVVLTTGKVPHKVTPVHEVALIGQEEADVLQLCGHLHGNHLATAVVGHLIAIHTTHPTLVGIGMGRTVHTREQHILGIFIFVLGAHFKVGVLLIGRGLVLALIYRGTLSGCGAADVTILLQFHLRGVGLAI